MGFVDTDPCSLGVEGVDSERTKALLAQLTVGQAGGQLDQSAHECCIMTKCLIAGTCVSVRGVSVLIYACNI